MAFLNFIDSLSWPISIIASLINIAGIVLMLVNTDMTEICLMAMLITIVISGIYMLIFLRLDLFKYIWAMISGGWKAGWTIGIAVFLIPGVNFIAAIFLALLLTGFALEFAILSLILLPIAPTIYKNVFA